MKSINIEKALIMDKFKQQNAKMLFVHKFVSKGLKNTKRKSSTTSNY